MCGPAAPVIALEGTGGPENASLAGLPAAYIAQQMADYKSGARKFAGPQRSPVLLMTEIAKATTDAEAQAAAAYFSSLKPKSVIRVVETDTVPATQIARVFYMLAKDDGTEPIGERIVEVPVDAVQFEHRELAFAVHGLCAERQHRKGRSFGQNRRSRHHFALRDLSRPGPEGCGIWFPGLPDVRRAISCVRSTTSSSIRGPDNAAALMAPVVEKLTHADMISLAAYISSLGPERTSIHECAHFALDLSHGRTQ